MNKQFRKNLLILMAFSMLISMLSVFSAGAAAVTETDYNDHLVTHWDFNSTTTVDDVVTVEDKAANGNSTDNLSTIGNVIFSNGCATIPVTGKNNVTEENPVSYLKSDTFEEGEDLYSFQNKTIIMKVRLDGSAKNGSTIGTALFYKNDVLRITPQTARQIQVRSLYNNGSKAVYASNISSDEKVISDEQAWQWIAVSLNFDENTGNYSESLYVAEGFSADELTAATFNSGSSSLTGTVPIEYIASYLTSGTEIILGKSASNQAKDSFFVLELDDIKIYDTAMSLEEVTESINAPTYRGVQFKSGTDSFDIRFNSTVDTLNLREVGYEITATYLFNGQEKTQDLSQHCSTVYKSVTGGDETYSAEDNYRSQYIMALAVTGIPQSLLDDGGSIVFTVKPYCISADGTQKISVETQQITVTYDAANAKYVAVAKNI